MYDGRNRRGGLYDQWPQQELPRYYKTGITDYSIFLDEETNYLFAYLTITDAELLNELPEQELMKRWWNYMKDIMETNDDNSPVSFSLKEVFYLD